MPETPDSDMLEPAVGIVRFMETRDLSALANVFAVNVALLDSFYPYFFYGPNAVKAWAESFIVHARATANLRHSFGEPQEFSCSNDMAFYSLPVSWTGFDSGPFDETGGLALLLVKDGGKWRVKNYAWAVTKFTRE